MYIAQDRPMQFFYRIFRKNKVLLRKRKIPNLSSQGKVDSVNSPLSNHATAATSTTTATKASSSSSSCNTGIASGGESSKALAGNSAKKTRMDVSDTNITIRCGVVGSAAVSSSTDGDCRPRNHTTPLGAPVEEISRAAQSHFRHQRQVPTTPKNIDIPARPFFDNRTKVANYGNQVGPQVLTSSPQSQPQLQQQQQQQPPLPRRHETINVTAKDVKQILEDLKEKTVAAAEAAAAKADVATANLHRKGPLVTQALASSATSKISQEQKLAIRNFRLGGGQQTPQPSASLAASVPMQGDSEKILSIVSNLHKKQVAKQQQLNLSNAPSRTASDGVHSALSPKTTIQKTTVSSIQFGTMAPSAKIPDAISTRVNKSSLVAQNQQQLQSVSAVSAMERHLAKTLPSGTAVTVKVAAAAAARAAGSGTASKDKPYNNRDGIITPILKKDTSGGGPRTDSVRKSLSDRSFINVSEALMKQKAVLSCASAGGSLPGQQQMAMPRSTMSAVFKTTAAASALMGSSAQTPPPKAVATSPSTALRGQFSCPVLATTSPSPPTTAIASTVAAAFPNLSTAVAANSPSPQLAAMTAAVAVANLEAVPTADSLAVQPQIPKSRLEVKLQQPSSPHNSVLNASSAVLAQPQQIISFRKQPPVAELLWSGPPVTTAAAAAAHNSLKEASGGGVVGPRKTLNQGIRQIPNPSLLTNKQKNDCGTGDATGTTE